MIAKCPNCGKELEISVERLLKFQNVMVCPDCLTEFLGSNDAEFMRNRELNGVKGIDEKEAVDLGLSAKWANSNVGARVAEESGGRYGWADPTGQKTLIFLGDYPNSDPPEQICGTEYDIATARCGAEWRLPTMAEFKELSEKCEWEWIKYNDATGMKVTGPNGNHIFLLAGGYRYDVVLYNNGVYGNYWSGNLYERNSGKAYRLYFENNHCCWDYVFGRSYGLCMRPVKKND
ncbi:MAG: hypothetical protein LKF31_00090 [Muribaculaceae bacterium]|jgi:uncharacterized protein (TIGR02145 family)|nr:hypothetical protein [Muribaculaceae bacterium]